MVMKVFQLIKKVKKINYLKMLSNIFSNLNLKFIHEIILNLIQCFH